MPNTANYVWNMPTVGADLDTWGDELNATTILIDAEMFKKANLVAPTFTGPVTVTGSMNVTDDITLGDDLTVMGTIGVGVAAGVPGVLVRQSGTGAVYIQSADAAPTGMAALYMAVSAGAINYWQMTTGGDTSGDLKIQHSTLGALVQISPQGRFRIGAIVDDGTSVLSVGGKVRTSTSSSGVTPGSGTQIFAESNTSGSYMEVAGGVAKGCGYLFSANATSLTSYITDINSLFSIVSVARPILFLCGGSERVRITTGGDVGVGIDNPSFRFQVAGGRSMFKANSEPYSVGVGYNAASPVMWIGTQTTGDLQVSEAGGSRLALMTQAGNWITRTQSAAALDQAKLDNQSFTVTQASVTQLRFFCRFSDGAVRSADLNFV